MTDEGGKRVTAADRSNRIQTYVAMLRGLGAHDFFLYVEDQIKQAESAARSEGREEGFKKAREAAVSSAEEKTVLFFTQSDLGDQNLILDVRKQQRKEISDRIKALRPTDKE